MVTIKECELYYHQVPLLSPYVLSFTTVEKLDLVLVRICLTDGSYGVAEAVPLPGYTKDTLATVLATLKPIAKECAGLTIEEARRFIKRNDKDNVIALSAFLTAIEMAIDDFVIPCKIDIPLLAPVSASSQYGDVLKKTIKLIESGYRTIKLKIGRDLDVDSKTVSLLLDELPEGIKLRIDANQGYNFIQAEKFLKVLDHPRNALIELLEQPLSVESWQEFAELTHDNRHIPLMLDESIVSDDDIPKSAQAGARLVKLKLCKHSGLLDLGVMAKYAKNLDMGVVLGNGVASDLGNVQEAAFFQECNLFQGAYEGNGFGKNSEMILENPPTIVEGRMLWTNNKGTRLDDLVRYDQMSRI